MSIDGIGRPPRPPSGVGPVEGTHPVAGADKTFQLERGAPVQGASLSNGPFARLERGEISLDQYLDVRVEDAVAPFVSYLAPEQVEFMKSSLRVELESDPVLVELLKRVASAVPASTEP